MERKRLPESEIRMILLQTIAQLEPVNAAEMTEFLAEVSAINYFEMMLGLIEMEKSGQVRAEAHPLGKLYSLTEKGMNNLRSFASVIPPSTRRRMEETAFAFRGQIRHEQQLPAVAIQQEDGTECIRLRFLEKDYPALDLMIFLEKDQHFPYLQARWTAAAHAVYSDLIATLTRGYAPSGERERLPEAAGLIPGDHEEWLVCLQNSDEAPTFSVTLAFADPELCVYCAKSWKNAWPQLKSDVLMLLKDWDEAEGR